MFVFCAYVEILYVWPYMGRFHLLVLLARETVYVEVEKENHLYKFIQNTTEINFALITSFQSVNSTLLFIYSIF